MSLLHIGMEHFRQYFEYFDHNIPTGRLQVLFGIHTEPYDSVKNIAFLIGKRTIWISKFRNQNGTQ